MLEANKMPLNCKKLCVLRQNVKDFPGQPKKSDSVCPICLDPPKKPVTTTCGHSFCHGCITKAVERRRECPTCRAEINVAADTDIPYTDFFYNLIGKLFIPKKINYLGRVGGGQLIIKVGKRYSEILKDIKDTRPIYIDRTNLFLVTGSKIDLNARVVLHDHIC
jgi:hypothetical protein